VRYASWVAFSRGDVNKRVASIAVASVAGLQTYGTGTIRNGPPSALLRVSLPSRLLFSLSLPRRSYSRTSLKMLSQFMASLLAAPVYQGLLRL
jgi:hypothetical protein